MSDKLWQQQSRAALLCCFALFGGCCTNLCLNIYSGCRGLTDVSSLGSIHTLYLSHCQGVTDVSSLGGVYSLDLSYCYGVTDVSSLGSVHRLNIRGLVFALGCQNC